MVVKMGDAGKALETLTEFIDEEKARLGEEAEPPRAATGLRTASEALIGRV